MSNFVGSMSLDRFQPWPWIDSPLEDPHPTFNASSYRFRLPAWTDIPKDDGTEKYLLESRVEVIIGSGSGQADTPFSITRKKFGDICEEIGFSSSLKRNIAAKTAFFEHQFIYDLNGMPTHLEIGMATYENDAVFMLLRYDIAENFVNSLVFLKEGDYLKYKSVKVKHLHQYFQYHEDILKRHPLMLLNVTMKFLQLGAHEYLRWRVAVNELESRIGLSRYGSLLEHHGYEKVSHDHGLLNAHLLGSGKKRADSERSAGTIHLHAKAFYRLVVVCEKYQLARKYALSFGGIPAEPITTEQREEVRSTITRAELYLRDTSSTAAVLESLNKALENRIKRRDTDATMTIAILGLIFVPAAFVSQVAQGFQAGLFESQNSDSKSMGLSRSNWLYVGICLFLTGSTLMIWAFWHVWGSFCVERYRITRIRSSKQISPDGLTAMMVTSRRGMSTDMSVENLV